MIPYTECVAICGSSISFSSVLILSGIFFYSGYMLAYSKGKRTSGQYHVCNCEDNDVYSSDSEDEENSSDTDDEESYSNPPASSPSMNEFMEEMELAVKKSTEGEPSEFITVMTAKEIEEFERNTPPEEVRPAGKTSVSHVPIETSEADKAYLRQKSYIECRAPIVRAGTGRYATNRDLESVESTKLYTEDRDKLKAVLNSLIKGKDYVFAASTLTDVYGYECRIRRFSAAGACIRVSKTCLHEHPRIARAIDIIINDKDIVIDTVVSV
jgi:hypothetical protein